MAPYNNVIDLVLIVALWLHLTAFPGCDKVPEKIKFGEERLVLVQGSRGLCLAGSAA